MGRVSWNFLIKFFESRGIKAAEAFEILSKHILENKENYTSNKFYIFVHGREKYKMGSSVERAL